MNGKELGRSSGLAIQTLSDLAPGSTLTLSGKEIEIMEEISKPSFAKAAPVDNNTTEKENQRAEPYRPKVIPTGNS